MLASKHGHAGCVRRLLDAKADASATDARGRTGFEDRDYPQAAYLAAMFDAASSVSTREIAEAGHQGPAFGQELSRRRKRAIETARADYPAG